MGERKVLNKYFPPDFDPDNVPRRKMDRDQRHKVRLMSPFNMQCQKCGDYIYKGKKFNAGKEIAHGEDYLGIQKFRFFIRCPMCCSEIVFKTDPENTDYEIEVGAQRNFEPWKEKAGFEEHVKKKREDEEEDNPIRALENRTKDSKRLMEDMDELEDIVELKNKHASLSMDEILELKSKREQEIQKKAREEEELNDEKLVQEVFSKDNIRRIDDDDDDDNDRNIGKGKRKKEGPTAVLVSTDDSKGDGVSTSGKSTHKGKPNGTGGGLLNALRVGGVAVKAAASGATVRVGSRGGAAQSTTLTTGPPKEPAGLGGLANYSSGSDESD